jgi:hypothetical protein
MRSTFISKLRGIKRWLSLSSRECPECKGKFRVIQHNMDNGVRRVKYECAECKHTSLVFEHTKETLARHSSRHRCPDCKSFTKLTNSSVKRFYTTRYRQCSCGWKSETFELAKDYFVAILKAAKEELPRVGGQLGNENASAGGSPRTSAGSAKS